MKRLSSRFLEKYTYGGSIQLPHVKTYGEICALERKLEYIDEQIRQLMDIKTPMAKIILEGFNEDYRIVKEQLTAIAKEHNLTTP